MRSIFEGNDLMTKSLEVVIVDDEIQITELLKTFIECSSVNTNIHTFNDAAEARSFLLGNDVDVLITDYKMPKFNGIELMETAPPDVKKVLISGYVSEIAEERLQQLDAVFFEKPVPMKALGKIILDRENKLG
ncbi:MAG: response regulator [Fibrobacter sp.]|nr:response regulator [Fibrobacter sp.]